MHNSLTNNLGLPNFDTLMKNASVSYSRLRDCGINRLFMYIVSAICVTNTLLYSLSLCILCL